ncbi:hypothetical protein J2S78_003056 [Salibacterium salarium]|uniref:DUF4003 family protein n=1 Tax=Salibacterium salarium TaxID=284579 RepID=UPI002786CD7A|nr:DUF4003 family protein [Salibacterium salarium]MDQ0300588.1 hypothetical protein [Salibacterium salarium]
MSETKINQYVELFETLKKAMKWKVFDDNIVKTIASVYVMNDKKWEEGRFFQVADDLKKEAGAFSSMKSHPRFTMAALLDVKFDQPAEKVPQLFDVYNTLKQEKFKGGESTYIAAASLLTQDESIQETAEKAMILYEKMKKEHPFITGASDYPLAVLLAMEEKNDMIERIENYYEALDKQGFKKGNELQFLSHILSLGSGENPQLFIQRAVEVSDAFKEAGIKSKPMYYPMIGMLALLPTDLFDMHDIQTMYEKLTNMKHFKWSKDMNVLIAGSFFVNEKLEHSGLTETSLYTTLESILQAQQAAMIAAITGATAAASSNGSN